MHLRQLRRQFTSLTPQVSYCATCKEPTNRLRSSRCLILMKQKMATGNGEQLETTTNETASSSTFEQSAKCYSEASSFQRNNGYRFIQELSPGHGCSVLDLGCGTGALAAALSEYVGREGKVIAVDPDGERLKIAREKHARDNIEYVVGNDATYPEGSYDLVFANQVVHWVKDKEALFGRVYQNLKSGASFAFITANGNPVWPPVVNDCMSELFGPDFIGRLFLRNMTFLMCDQYRELAESNGFVVTSMEDKDVPGFQIDGLDDLIGFFFGLLQGELDRTSISEQALQACRDKYEDDLCSQASVQLKTRKLLHVVLTKP